MSSARIFRRSAVVGFAVVSVLAAASISSAQTTPRIEHLFPAGAQRGTSVEIELGGEFMPDACRLSIAGDGLELQPLTNANRYRLSVAAQASLGAHDVRLASVQGASAPFPFVVGELPEVVHVERGKTLNLKLPVTANGRLESAGEIDEYSVTLAAGTQIVCAATARILRSPVDLMIRVLDADGNPLAVGSPHRALDALLVFRAPRAGRYTIQVFDFQLSGGAGHVYRLTMTDGPWLDHVFPHGVSRTTETSATLFGWNLPSASGTSLDVRIPPQSASQYEVTIPGGANRLTIPVGEGAESLETEPNDDSATANPLRIDSTINGRLGRAEDVDWFAIDAKKGEQFGLQVDSAALDFPADVVVAIVNGAGKKLIETDDFKASLDPRLRYTVPSDGRYFVMLQDRSRRGGADFVYRLHRISLRPDVTARVNAASLTVHAGKSQKLPVLVERIDGLTDELEVTVVDLPEGVTVAPQAVPAKTPAAVELSFAVTDKTAPIARLIRIVVRSKSKSPAIERDAVIAESPTAATTADRLWLAVSPEIPFTLKTQTAILDAPRMAAFPFPVTVERQEGFKAPIRLVGVEPDRRGTVVPLEGRVLSGENAGSIPLVIQHKTIEGTTHRCRVMGVAEVPGIDGKTYAVFHVATGSMSIGCQPSLLTMTVDPPIVIGKPGTSQRIAVRLMRRAAMGPITLRLMPPAGVEGLDCDSVEINADANVATLTLRLSGKTKLPPRATIEVKAESSHDGLPIYAATFFRLESPR